MGSEQIARGDEKYFVNYEKIEQLAKAPPKKKYMWLEGGESKRDVF